MVALPLAGCAPMAKALAASPSVSLAFSVPVMAAPSSVPAPLVAPPMVVESSPADTMTLTVAVSVTPPEVTV